MRCPDCRWAHRQETSGARSQRARDSDALLLAAGELLRCVARGRKGRPPRGPARELRRSRAGRAAIEERELDVLERGRALQQIEALKDEAEIEAPQDRAGVAERADIETAK